MKQNLFYSSFELVIELEADTISMKSVATTSNGLHVNSEPYKVLEFLNKHYSEGTHK